MIIVELASDRAANNEAHHRLQPYGSRRRPEPLQVAGQDARLILPSNDQLRDMKGQAALIVRYPQPVVIDSITYVYFVLHADGGHGQSIARTLVFTGAAPVHP